MIMKLCKKGLHMERLKLLIALYVVESWSSIEAVLFPLLT